MHRNPRNARVTADLVLTAYHQGFFPMANERGEIGFYAYEPRGILPLDDRFLVRRSLRQILARDTFEIRFDTATREVLAACSRSGAVSREEQWLSDDLIEIYLELSKRGVVHTVEVWQEGQMGRSELVGGLYGLAIGSAFSGESMFSVVPYASQIALVALVERLRAHGFTLLDAQMPSDHLKQFGLYECTQSEYMSLFLEASARRATF
jgi:leucyl/phenylalanyl-tRNA--protein transferase